jgi:Fe-S-cluster containining protein
MMSDIYTVDIEKLREQAKHAEPSTNKLFTLLKKKQPKNLDDIVHKIHDEVFEKIDCLTCANCCKTTSPAIRESDMNRLAKALRMKPSQVIEKYLRLDEEGDYVVTSAPCPFLGPDNYCSVYEGRPTACREYPHTNRKRFHQVLDLTSQNVSICPAAFAVVERMKQELAK